MPDAKWIPGLTADTPVVEAARRVLGVRFGVVRHFLPLAARHPAGDVEYVHQLRVATRRTAAALRIFESCLPAKRVKEARRGLRRLRRAAGEARDWDVFLGTLAEWTAGRSAEEVPGIDFLHGYAFDRRGAAQAGLVDAAGAGIDAAGILAAVGEPADFAAPRRLGDLAESAVNELLRKLDAEIKRPAQDFEQLHRVRIRGKRLRYAMEVFADCFAPAFRRDLYPAVERMQEVLGQANDSHVAARRLEELAHRLKTARPADWRRYASGLEHLLACHRRRLPEARDRFASWRAAWRRMRTASPCWKAVREGSAAEKV